MASDPYRYFRIEARELVDGLGQGVLELEKGSSDVSIVPRLLRLAHTLKGAARVVKQLEIAELSHRVEEVLARGREAGRGVDTGEARELLSFVDRMGELASALAPAPVAATSEEKAVLPARERTPTRPEEALQTVRVEVEEMDGLLRAITETGVQLSALRRATEAVHQLAALSATLTTRLARRGRHDAQVGDRERALADDLQAGLERSGQTLGAGVERVQQELDDVRDAADRLRLVPAQTLAGPLERAVRDAAQALGKRAEFALSGGELRLDAHVLGPLKDALLHLVRNAVAHGIETPAERSSAQKPLIGSVRLGVERRRGGVVLTCRDDGKGIDTAAVRRELVARGSLDARAGADLPTEALLELLLSAGLTTSREVTQISGRGIGLDVVRETIARLQGEVRIQTQAGRGTSVEVSVPISLSGMRALLVEAGGATLAIPLDAVLETVRLSDADFRRSPEGDSVARGGKLIPFLPLGTALKQGKVPSRNTWSAVVVGVADRSAAIGVDHLRGAFDVVVKPVPSIVNADPIVSGASFDGEGNPQLVLDAASLLAAATENRGTSEAPGREQRPILVIDDSLTTRMLEQSILESAGYEVDLAVSAEQGLEKARQRNYALFIVDVEMPGMDGFEFVTRTRADPELGKIPAILVTSRNEPDDLRRGKEVGASAYIVKGEFDQGLLLDRIRGLVG